MIKILQEKMYQIASYLNELNANDKVKGFTANEYGYAKVVQVKPGLSVWVHHLKDDKLIIDLLCSEKAKKLYHEEYDKSKNVFKLTYRDQVIEDIVIYKTNNSKGYRLYYEISDIDIEECLKSIDLLKNALYVSL